MRRYLQLLRRKRFLAVYGLTVLGGLLIAYGIYRGEQRVTERKPVNVALLGKVSEMQDGSLLLFDITDPGEGFGSTTPFEDNNVIRLEAPDLWIFEPNDPAKLHITTPLVVDGELSGIPQYTLEAGEDSIVHINSPDAVRLDFTPSSDLHVLVGFPDDFSRQLGVNKRLLTFDLRAVSDPPAYAAELSGKEGTQVSFQVSRTDPAVLGRLIDTFSFHGRMSPATMGRQRLGFDLGAPGPVPGIGLVAAGDLSTDRSNLDILVPVKEFFTIHASGSMVLGQQRLKIEATDRLQVRNMTNGSVRIRSDSDVFELHGTTKDISLNGVPLVQREFERMSASLQGAIAGLITTVLLALSRLILGVTTRVLRESSRTE
jgi:hypothetical protein